jgi:hypothetical protein
VSSTIDALNLSLGPRLLLTRKLGQMTAWSSGVCWLKARPSFGGTRPTSGLGRWASTIDALTSRSGHPIFCANTIGLCTMVSTDLGISNSVKLLTPILK